MSTSVKISELNSFVGTITSSDYFPVNKSSSLTTYRAPISSLQSFLSTGSFTGSFIGTLTGTASWANNALTASFVTGSRVVGTVNSASYALSASYAQNAGGLSGTGTAQYFAKWNSANSLTDASMYYSSVSSSNISTDNFQVYGTNKYLRVYGNAQPAIQISSTFNSTLILDSLTTASDGMAFVVGSDGYYYTFGNPLSASWGRGSFEWISYTGSNNWTFGGKDYTADNLGYGILRVMRLRSNGFYFWPLAGVQSISKDGTFNIGVDSGTENHETRLMIQVYSGSSASPTVDHLHKAIEVYYGSGSVNNVTFCVSSSGKTYIGDKLQINGGVQLKADNNYSAITSLGTNVSINAENYTTKFINLGNHGTASITMSRGSQLNVIVNQAASSGYTASLFFTGSYISSSGETFNCPIVWRNGSQPAVTVGSGDKADFFTFVAVNTHNNGPKGSGATDNTVIYGTVVQNMY
jgi:hypothetical protein